MRMLALILALALAPAIVPASEGGGLHNHDQLRFSIERGLRHYGIRADLDALSLSQAVELNFLLDSSEGRGALNRLRKRQKILNVLRKADAL